MKTKLAIEYFEDAVRESDEIIDDCSAALKAELTEQKGHFIVGLDALREKAEREQFQPCGYCTPDENGEYLAKVFYSPSTGEHITVMFCDSHAFVTIKREAEQVFSVPIQFCAICGRALKSVSAS